MNEKSLETIIAEVETAKVDYANAVAQNLAVAAKRSVYINILLTYADRLVSAAKDSVNVPALMEQVDALNAALAASDAELDELKGKGKKKG